MIVVTIKNDPEVSKKIWPSFKETLEEKHGKSGTIGDSGEEKAITLFEDAFGDVKFAAHHKDGLSQMMGIDFTICISGKYYFVDIKSGSSSLFYDKSIGGKSGWYITLRKNVINKNNKTDIIMHLGPKGDVYAWYHKKQMREFVKEMKDQELKLYISDWPEWIKTSL